MATNEKFENARELCRLMAWLSSSMSDEKRIIVSNNDSAALREVQESMQFTAEAKQEISRVWARDNNCYIMINRQTICHAEDQHMSKLCTWEKCLKCVVVTGIFGRRFVASKNGMKKGTDS